MYVYICAREREDDNYDVKLVCKWLVAMIIIIDLTQSSYLE